VILISANAEWRALDVHGTAGTTPWGETIATDIDGDRVVFVHGGWGKIAAAASAQYAIDTFHPRLLVNLGTCGGFAGKVQPMDTVVVERTVVYDIIERMGDPDEAIADYATSIDLGWAGSDAPGVRGTLASGDQDIDPARIAELEGYGAIAGDWESGAIAKVAARNHTRLLILRGVTDVVDASGDVTYGNQKAFDDAARTVMTGLVRALPGWLSRDRRAPARGASTR